MKAQSNSWLTRLESCGLMVAIHEGSGRIEIVRPSSVSGISFDDYVDYPVGIAFNDGEVFIKANAPIAVITRKHRPKRWNVDISEPAVPGPSLIYLSDTFASLEEAADAVIRCYFSDGITEIR